MGDGAAARWPTVLDDGAAAEVVNNSLFFIFSLPDQFLLLSPFLTPKNPTKTRNSLDLRIKKRKYTFVASLSTDSVSVQQTCLVVLETGPGVGDV